MAMLTAEPGQTIGTRTFNVDRARLVDYAAASGDQNPIHQDEEFARSVGLPDVIAHGMWTMGVAVQVAVDWAGDPGRIVSYSTRFTAPVVVPADGGAEVEVTGTVASVDETADTATVALAVTCAGQKVLGRATAVVRLS